MAENDDTTVKEQKTSYTQILIIVFLLIMSLPVFYFLVAKVLLPLEWKEEPVEEEKLSLLQSNHEIS